VPDFSLVPVDYQPDFSDASLVPVDHDPFAGDGGIRQAQAQPVQIQTQPVQPQPLPPQPVQAQPQPTSPPQPPVIGDSPGGSSGGVRDGNAGNNSTSSQGRSPAPVVFPGYADPALMPSRQQILEERKSSEPALMPGFADPTPMADHAPISSGDRGQMTYVRK
jgi:hypothetical protein